MRQVYLHPWLRSGPPSRAFPPPGMDNQRQSYQHQLIIQTDPEDGPKKGIRSHPFRGKPTKAAALRSMTTELSGCLRQIGIRPDSGRGHIPGCSRSRRRRRERLFFQSIPGCESH